MRSLSEEIKSVLVLVDEDDYISWRPMEDLGIPVTRFAKARRLPLLTSILNETYPSNVVPPKITEALTRRNVLMNEPTLWDALSWLGHKPGCTVITAPPDGDYRCGCGFIQLMKRFEWPK